MDVPTSPRPHVHTSAPPPSRPAGDAETLPHPPPLQCRAPSWRGSRNGWRSSPARAPGSGRATALRLARRGRRRRRVWTSRCRRPSRRRPTSARAGGTARAYQVDVSDPRSVRETRAAARRATSAARSVLVNCAGIGRFANAHDMPFEDWSRIIARQPHRHVPDGAGGAAASARGRRQHRQHRLERRPDGPAVQRRLLRVEGRRRAT